MPIIGDWRETDKSEENSMYRRAKCPAFLFASGPAFAEIELRELHGALHGAGGEDLGVVV